MFVLGLTAARLHGRDAAPASDGVPAELLKERLPEPGDSEDRARRRLHVAITRAREERGAVLGGVRQRRPARPSPLLADARAAVGAEEEVHEEELFGPEEGLHSTFRDHARRAAGHGGRRWAAGSARCAWTPPSTCRMRWRASSSW